jgi:hypothetical protein
MFSLSLHTTRKGPAFHRVVPGVKLTEMLFLTGFFMPMRQRDNYGSRMGFLMPESEAAGQRAARWSGKEGRACRGLETP